jgi:hypothetical protein
MVVTLYIIQTIKEQNKLIEAKFAALQRKVNSLEDENKKMKTFLCAKFDDFPGCVK